MRAGSRCCRWNSGGGRIPTPGGAGSRWGGGGSALRLPRGARLVALDRLCRPICRACARRARRSWTGGPHRSPCCPPRRHLAARDHGRRFPPHLLDMLIAAEDRRFRLHPGVDPLALGARRGAMGGAGRVISGGSTLAMQAARLLEPRPRIPRQGDRDPRAVQLEARYGKDDILGIGSPSPRSAATSKACGPGRSPGSAAGARLEPAEAALLVALPRRPEGCAPTATLRPRRRAAPRARARRGSRIGPEEFDAAPVRGPAAASPATRRKPRVARRGPGAGRDDTRSAAARGAERLTAERLHDLPARASLAVLIADANSAKSARSTPVRGDEQRAGGA